MLDPANAFVAKLFKLCVTRGSEHFSMQATARGSVASGEVASQDPERVSAFALALPIDASLVGFTSSFEGANYGKSAKYCIS